MTLHANSMCFKRLDAPLEGNKPVRPPRYKDGIFFIFLFLILMTPAGPAMAQDPVETLDKIGQFINQAKEMVESIRDGEHGEKELLGELAARYSSNEDLTSLCREYCGAAGKDTTIAEYHLLYSGRLQKSRPIDLVKLVKEKLAADGFNILHEESSGGRKTIWFDDRPAGQAREKRYVLWISEGWFRKMTDFFTGRETNRSFCLAKVTKI